MSSKTEAEETSTERTRGQYAVKVHRRVVYLVPLVLGVCLAMILASSVTYVTSPAKGTGVAPAVVPGDFAYVTCTHGAVYLNGSLICHDQSDALVGVCGGGVCSYLLIGVMDSQYSFGGWTATGNQYSCLGYHPSCGTSTTSNPAAYWGYYQSGRDQGYLTLNTGYGGKGGYGGESLYNGKTNSLCWTTLDNVFGTPSLSVAQGPAANLQWSWAPGSQGSCNYYQGTGGNEFVKVVPGWATGCNPPTCAPASGQGSGFLVVGSGEDSGAFNYGGPTGLVDINATVSAYDAGQLNGAYESPQVQWGSQAGCVDSGWALDGYIGLTLYVYLRSGSPTGPVLASTNITLLSSGWVGCSYGGTFGGVQYLPGDTGNAGWVTVPETWVPQTQLTDGNTYAVTVGFACTSVGVKVGSGGNGGVNTFADFTCTVPSAAELGISSFTYSS